MRKTDYDYYISYIESGGNILSSQSYIAEFDGLVKNTDTTLGSQYRIRTLPDKNRTCLHSSDSGNNYCQDFLINTRSSVC